MTVRIATDSPSGIPGYFSTLIYPLVRLLKAVDLWHGWHAFRRGLAAKFLGSLLSRRAESISRADLTQQSLETWNGAAERVGHRIKLLVDQDYRSVAKGTVSALPGASDLSAYEPVRLALQGRSGSGNFRRGNQSFLVVYYNVAWSTVLFCWSFLLMRCGKRCGGRKSPLLFSAAAFSLLPLGLARLRPFCI
jgi:hypothetical protein